MNPLTKAAGPWFELSKLRRYPRALRKWWWLVLGAFALGVGWSEWKDLSYPELFMSRGRVLASGMEAVFETVKLGNAPAWLPSPQSKLMGSIQVHQRAAAYLERNSPQLRTCPVKVSIVQEPATSFFYFVAIGEEPEYTQTFLNALMESSVTVLQGIGLGEAEISIADYATSPESTKPRVSRLLFTGGLAGMIVGLEIVFVIALVDRRVMSPAELEETFAGTILEHVPHSVLRVGDWINTPYADSDKGKALDAYRRLRSNLHFMPFEGPRPKAFLVTSAESGEGKSSVAANLAIALAAAGSRTLLIDADLKNGLLHDHFSIKREPGVSEILKGFLKLQDCVVLTNVPNLTVLPRGRTDWKMTDRSASDFSDRFLRQVFSSDYEQIVFDSSPVFAGADTVSLAPKIDAVLFVIREELSVTKVVRKALDTLHKSWVNVIGVIYTA